jgi:hypothetical protein
MRRYNYDEDLDYSHENSVDDYDMRSYTPRNGYHNMDYDDDNWWQPEEEYEYEQSARNSNNYENNYDVAETPRHRHLRPLGTRRSVDNNAERNSDYDRRNYRNSSRNSSRYYNNNENRNQYNNDWNRTSHSGSRRNEYDYQNEGYGGRNANDYTGRNYGGGYYYDPDDYNQSDVRNRNEYEYADYDEDDGRRRRKRWSDDVEYYQSVPSYRRRDDDYLEPKGNERSFRGRDRRLRRMDEQDDERGKFSDRRHDFGYYADDRYDDYPRRRPNIRDSKY